VQNYWSKRLEIVGTGYNVKIQGADLNFRLGFSHPVIFKAPKGIQLAVDGNNIVIVSGVDKQQVGEVAQRIKGLKKPDAYKGKGVRYEGEYIKLKPGKKAKA
jgi:large subunit ribosomal protein L6